MRSVLVPRQLDPLPRCKIAVDLFFRLLYLFLQLFYAVRNVNVMLPSEFLELLQLYFQVINRFFKIQNGGHYVVPVCCAFLVITACFRARREASGPHEVKQ